MDEVKKRRGRPRKDRGGILPDDAVEALKTPEQRASEEQEKIRVANLERKRRQRQREAAQRDQARTAASCSSRQEFWMSQRALLSPTELTEMKEFSQRVQDLQDSMLLAGEPVPPEWEGQIDFISVDETVKQVVAFVKEHGVAHLGSIFRDDSIPVDWSTRNYFHNAELFHALCSESEQTKNWCTYGFAGLSDRKVADWLHRKAKYSWNDAARLVGWTWDTDGRFYHGGNAPYAAKPTAPTAATQVDEPNLEDATIDYQCPDCATVFQALPKAIVKGYVCPRCEAVAERKRDEMLNWSGQ